MNRQRALASLVAVLVAIAFPPQALASDAKREAQALFQAGAKAYARGEFAAAARAFEAAHDKAPAGPVVLNAARAWDAAKYRARAADDYAAAMRIGGLSAKERKEATDRLDVLTKTLGLLEISGGSAIVASVAHAERIAVPARVYLQPGEHSVTIHHGNGHRSHITVALVAGESTPLDPPATAPPSTPTRPTPPSQASFEDPPNPAPGSASTWGWVSLGVGVAAAGATTYLGLSALDARDDYVASGRLDVDAHDRARNLRTATNIALGTAIVTSGIGGYLLLFHQPGKRSTGSHVACAALTSGVRCRARW